MPLTMAAKETQFTMNTMIKPIVDELMTLKDGVEVQVGDAEAPIKLQVMVMLTVCDDPGKKNGKDAEGQQTTNPRPQQADV